MINQTIALESDQVPKHLRNVDGYSGRTFKAHISEGRVRIPGEAGFWSGGSRDTYFAIRIATGEHLEFPRNQFGSRMADHFYDLTPSVAVVRHSIFCGKDIGLTFYMLASDVSPLLPAPSVDLMSEGEQIVLGCVVGLLSSYRRQAAARHGIGSAAYDEAVASLKGRGYLSANGGVTPAGRNACQRRIT